ncbi:MAG TPA: hypothetical protein VLJ41_03080, partial [Segetibacter sp.]|nr:hypothetical protein [Segetibacter sp.]
MIVSQESFAQTYFTAPGIETGVSEKLAVYRKQTLSFIKYDLKLSIPAKKEAPIAASELITLSLSKNQAPLQLDFKERRDHLKSISANGRTVPITFLKEHVIVDSKFLKTGVNNINISFTAGDLSLNRNDDFLYTLLVPDRARSVFPCFDQPDLKATFTLSLTVPTAWQAVGNGPLVDSSINSGNKTLHFASSDTISTYLFSFVAGKFTVVRKNVSGRTMNFFHRETDAAKINYSIDSIFRLHDDAIRFLEDYTQIPFPFKKLDFIAIPDFQY